MTGPLLDPPRHRPTWGDLWPLIVLALLVVGYLVCPDLTGAGEGER